MIHFSGWDIAVVVLYVAGVLGIGWYAVRRQRARSAAEFLLAGRSLTVPVFVMTLVSTWYGGILGVGEFTYSVGIATWVMQGVPYYIFAILFAFLLAGRIRSAGGITIPDRLEQVYDRRTAFLGAWLTFLLMTPAPYVLMIGVLIQMITGWGLPLCILSGTIVTGVFLLAGGFRADVYTDVYEFILMFAGFGLILPFAVHAYGGWDFLAAHLPPLHLTWHGGSSPQFIIVWFFIALWTLVDPSFYQRCAAASSPDVARRGILWSVLFWVIFDMMTATVGLYARAALPGITQPVMAYPLIAEALLPPVAKGFFFVGLLATMMSTLNTLMLVSGTMLGRDMVRLMRGWREQGSTVYGAGSTEHEAGLQDGEEAGKHERRRVQWGMVVSAVLAIGLALAVPSVIKLWYVIGTTLVPGLLVPLVTSYFDDLRVDARTAFYAMLGGWLTSLIWMLAGWQLQYGSAESYPWGIEPMFPGLAVSVAVWMWGKMRARTT
ncbi:MAG: sodium:solute symporter family protein [Ignavibacteriae bacterium]|nr:sodium:solute symporter family protein [Ignavibacteriota bacterium]